MRVRLIETNTRTIAEATLLPITMEHIKHAEIAWRDEFRRRQQLSIGDEDCTVWNQGVMSGAPIKGHARKGYVIIHGEEVQGIALFDELLRPSRRRPDSMLLYINYIATAPWNRKSADGPGRFRQVGRILVAQSVRESITLGCPGRIGLHSYPSTSPFYDILRFENFGPDATRRGLNYFELRPGAAFDLLSDFGARSSLTVENL